MLKEVFIIHEKHCCVAVFILLAVGSLAFSLFVVNSLCYCVSSSISISIIVHIFLKGVRNPQRCIYYFYNYYNYPLIVNFFLIDHFVKKMSKL